MPEGKLIPMEQGEYPEIDGLEDGATVTFSGTATKEAGGLLIQTIELETEGMADRELSSMTKQQGTSSMSQPAIKKVEDM
jgi:Molybdopterin converting factor, large subunit